MNLYKAISERKSTRNYTDISLPDAMLKELLHYVRNLPLLTHEGSLHYRIVSATKGLFHIKAPHYLIISGSNHKDDELNAGFVGQNFVLYLHMLGIGSVWQGKVKDTSKRRSKNDLIVIAFGNSNETIIRELSAFKRKKLEEITNIVNDDCMAAVQLAPSGLNLQPWYFAKKDQKIVVYKQTLKAPLSLLYKTTDVDMGIALSHYALACKHFNKPFAFKKLSGKSGKKSYKLFGEISS